MEKKHQILIELAINTAACLSHKKGDKLEEKASCLLDLAGLVFSPEDIYDYMDGYDKYLSARLMWSYSHMPTEVKSPFLLLKIARILWLERVLAAKKGLITFKDIDKMLAEKSDEEFKVNPRAKDEFSSLSKLVDRMGKDEEILDEVSEFCFAIEKYIVEATSTCTEVLEKIQSLNFAKNIYGENLTNRIQTLQQTNEEINEVFIQQIENDKILHLQQSIDNLMADNSRLKEQIAVLESRSKKRQKRDSVNLDHADRDNVRKILTALTDFSMGSPLSELYLISLAEPLDTVRIRGVIRNLFASLKNCQITLTEEKDIGKRLDANSIKKEKYTPYPHEQLSETGCVQVIYPGYAYQNQTIIKPVLRKYHLEEKNDDK